MKDVEQGLMMVTFRDDKEVTTEQKDTRVFDEKIFFDQYQKYFDHIKKIENAHQNP